MSNSNDFWISISGIKKNQNAPSEIKIAKSGNIYIDGEIYNQENCKYKNLSVSVEKHTKINTGEETQKMIKASKKAKKGDTITIMDVKDPNKLESTTIKY